ncbi:MAG: sulfatase-like hydrolase/transferase [Kiritimatiellae bacterium]|nr:sulfatase-like hydrolase/transferase [Kiritimatiellia bacterium]
MKTCRTFLELCVALLVLCRTALSSLAAQCTNILVVVADDLGYDLWDHPARKTPRLDTLVDSSLWFRNAWCNPVCSPTRACVLTGRYSYRTGVGAGCTERNDSQLPLDEVTTPEVLDANPALGYAHAAIGKWHLTNSRNGGLDGIVMAGFSYFSGMFANAGFYDWAHLTSARQPDGSIVSSERTDSTYSTTVIVDDALAWIAARDPAKPWYLHLAFQSIHKPFHRPPDALHTFDERGYNLSTNVLAQQLAALEAMDTELGRLLDNLGADVLARTTLIFLSDNGTTSEATQPPYDPNRTKHWVYQGGVRVPMFVAGAGVASPGRTTDGIVNMTDVFATILELAGVDLAAGIPGPRGPPVALDSVSLAPYLMNPDQACLRRHVYTEQFDDNHGRGPMKAVRNVKGIKLIQQIPWLDPAAFREELYDLRNDPMERVNLLPLAADHPLQADLAELRRELDNRAEFAAHRAGAPQIAQAAVPGSNGVAAVSLAQDDPADSVWYTVNGDDPGANGVTSLLYSGPFQVGAGTTVRARAYRSTRFPSPITSATIGDTVFVSYNDLCLAGGDATSNITGYATGESGPLTDYATGEPTAVTLQVSGTGVVHADQGLPAVAGTDAADVFGGRVGLNGLVGYGSGQLALSFSGLDTGLRHELVLFGNRGVSAYTGRTTAVQLSGAEPGFRNDSSAGVAVSTTVLSNDTSTVCNGYNTANGYVARFTDVRAGADGTIALVLSAAADKYYANGLMIRGYGHPARPAAPTHLSAIAVSATRVQISWADNSGNETGFKLKRSLDGGQSWSLAAQPGPDAVTCVDTGLRPNTRYGYKIKATALEETNDSSYTLPIQITTPQETSFALPAGSVWRYKKATAEASDPPDAWRAARFDDSAWAAGAAPFGYGDGPYGTTLSDMRAAYSSVFLRSAFVAPQSALVAGLRLRVRYDDGFVAWLNGAELARCNVDGSPGTLLACTGVAAGSVADGTVWSNTYSGETLPLLQDGTNVLAIQAFNVSLAGSSDLTLDAVLSLELARLSAQDDADGDSLPEAWEAAQYADAANWDSAADPDGDGIPNLGEYIMGSDPTDGLSVLNVATRRRAGAIEVILHTVGAAGPGYEGLQRHYALEQCREGSGAGMWCVLPGWSDILADGRSFVCTNTAADGACLYRARVWLTGP